MPVFNLTVVKTLSYQSPELRIEAKDYNEAAIKAIEASKSIPPLEWDNTGAEYAIESNEIED